MRYGGTGGQLSMDIPCMDGPNSSNMVQLCLIYMWRRYLGRSASNRRHGGDTTLDEVSWRWPVVGLEVNSHRHMVPCMVTPWWLNSSNMTHLCLLYMCRWWLSRSTSFNSREGDATLDEVSLLCAVAGLERLSPDRHIVYDNTIVASNSSNMVHLCLVHMCRWSLKGSATMDCHGSIVVIDLCSWWCQMKRHEVNSWPPYRV